MFKFLSSKLTKEVNTVGSDTQYVYVLRAVLDKESLDAVEIVKKDIVEKLSKQFIDQYSSEIISKLDKKAISNLVAMYVGKELSKEVK